MAESAEAVVVGGGILGCSAALHLIETGISDVTLLERDNLAQATSQAGAGFVGVWAQGYLGAWKSEEVEIERYGLAFYEGLAQDGYEFDYKRNGNLWAATTQEAWDTHIDPIANHSAVPERQVLTSDEVEEVTGIIPSESIIGGVLFPNGCQVSAPKASAAVGARFVATGGRLELRRPVERIVVKNGRVCGLDTSQGRIDTETVVVAAGAWTNFLLRELGFFVPMVPLVQSRIITEPLGVPSTMPTLMLQEFNHIWLREERGGLLWGSTYEETPGTTSPRPTRPIASTTSASTAYSRCSKTGLQPPARSPSSRATGASQSLRALPAIRPTCGEWSARCRGSRGCSSSEAATRPVSRTAPAMESSSPTRSSTAPRRSQTTARSGSTVSASPSQPAPRSSRE